VGRGGQRARGWEKATSYKTDKHDTGESYGGIVTGKRAKKRGRPPAEMVEGRTLTKENAGQPNPNWTPSQGNGQSGLDRVREAARKNGKVRFTALLHHVTVDLLQDSYFNLKKKAAPGVDGVTWEEYGRDLEAKLNDLHGPRCGRRSRFDGDPARTCGRRVRHRHGARCCPTYGSRLRRTGVRRSR